MNAIFSRLTIVVIAIAAATGCRMADPLYDPCSPVMTGQMPHDPLCDPLFRLGSAYYRNGAYASGRLDDGATLQPTGSISTSGRQFNADDAERITGPRRAVPANPTLPENVSSPPATRGGSGGGNTGGMRFRPPRPETMKLGIPATIPATSPSPVPWETPASPQLPATPPASPSAARETGISLEMLRKLDPSITDVEIVEIREGANAVR